MVEKPDRKIVFEDGSEIYGTGFGARSEKLAELVFNTSMVGYQEILSDPSYTYQAVVMTYPLIGNYGMNDDDYETDVPSISALVVHEYNDEPSNFRSAGSLAEVMEKYDIAGIEGIDTRMLTRRIRDYGSCKILITDAARDVDDCVKYLKEHEVPRDAVPKVSTKSIYESKAGTGFYRVVAVDCGMKKNIVRKLNAAGCDVVVVPWNTDAETIASYHPDGVFLSNGPGDPEDCGETIETVRRLHGKYPIFGICLGHQILSLSYGAETYKLKFGHRGGNHPVMNMLTDKVEITSQNHSYAVRGDLMDKAGLEITHLNLLDNTVEGMRCVKDRSFSVQYHPESAPGPQDSGYLFGEFINLMKANKSAPLSERREGEEHA